MAAGGRPGLAGAGCFSKDKVPDQRARRYGQRRSRQSLAADGRDTHASILEQVEAQLTDVDAAFERLERGAYGICEACGGQIEPARLEERPFARFCLEDQQRVEREAGLPGSTG
jgi:RNA polymerase-binding transcription factor DksA